MLNSAITVVRQEVGRFHVPLVRRMVGLAVFLWLGIRAVAAMFMPIFLDPISSLAIVLLCAVVLNADYRRYRAHIYYANLGIAPLQPVIAALLVICALEGLTQIVGRTVAIQ